MSQGVTARSSVFAIGRSSRSTVRSSRLYLICRPTKRRPAAQRRRACSRARPPRRACRRCRRRASCPGARGRRGRASPPRSASCSRARGPSRGRCSRCASRFRLACTASIMFLRLLPIGVDVAGAGRARVLRGEHDPLALPRHELAEEGLAAAAAVEIGGVDEVAAGLAEARRRRAGSRPSRRPSQAAERHRAERELGYAQPTVRRAVDTSSHVSLWSPRGRADRIP